MKKSSKKAIGIAAGVLMVAGIANSFRPKPVDVDATGAVFGPMRVTVDDDGKTRVRDRYTVSAPVAGRAERIELDPGDPVKKDETVLAVIEPGDPALLDARAAEQAAARLDAARAAREQAELELQRAVAAHRLASNDLARAHGLLAVGGISRQAFDQAEFTERNTAGGVTAALRGLEIAAFEVEQARAMLKWMGAGGEEGGKPARYVVRSPVSGSALRVFDKSARVVAPGTPLVETGNPADLEVVVDVLSADAVRVPPGARVILEHWGGGRPLEGRVQRVEPAAFTKLSALGIEEQRVNVIVELIDPPEKRRQLGDGYRVEARIITWESDGVLRVPAGALFRADDRWAVFAAEKGRARLRKLEIGHMNGTEAEVLEGLDEGDLVVVHPGDTVSDGAAVRVR